ncbi:MAG: hypothetical protein WBD36_11750 [Bacteroidota bacterium]
MNQKTERPREFSQDFITFLTALTVATLVFLFFSEKYLYSGSVKNVRLTMFPWVMAAGQTIAAGLSDFAGEAPETISSVYRLSVLGSLLIGLVLGPTLFFFAWRERKTEESSGEAFRVLRASTIMFILGGIIVLSVVMPSLPASIIQRVVSNDLHRAQAIQATKDCMMNDLNTVTFGAVQYHHLPKALGGGEGSYAGFVLPLDVKKTTNASYELVSTAKDEAQFKATSLEYPSASIAIRVDAAGEIRHWEFTGEFQ